MRFIRKNGRVIPIKEKSDSSHAVGREISFRSKQIKTTAKSRFKGGAAIGSILGTFGTAAGAEIGAHLLPRRPNLGALAGAVAAIGTGALIGGSLYAAFGARKQSVLELSAIRKRKR